AIAACSGGGGSSLPPAKAPAAGPGTFKLSLAVPAPPKSANARVRKAFAASAATQGIRVNLYTSPYTGSSTPVLTQAFDVSATSAICQTSATDLSRTCTLSVAIAPGTYDVQVVTYDQAPSGGSIPVAAHELGYGFMASQTVTSGSANTLGMTVEGIPNSIAVHAPVKVLHPMYGLTENVSVSVLDAAGSVILGSFIDTAGNPVTVTVSDNGGTGTATISPASFTSSQPNGVTVTYDPNRLSVSSVAVPNSIDVDAQMNNPAVGAIDSIAIPQLVHTYSGIGGSGPAGIGVGSDNQIWFTMPGSNTLNSLSPFSGSFGPSPAPASSSAPVGPSPHPADIINGPDSNLWYSNSNSSSIGTISVTGSSQSGYALSGYASALTSDGTNIWGVEPSANNVFKMTTAGAVTELAIPTAGSAPNGIAVDANGDIWFTEEASAANKVGEINSASGIVNNEYVLPTINAAPLGITKGSDGNMYVAESGGDRIAMVSTQPGTFGQITEYVMTSGSYVPGNLTTGPDGAIWFTINGGVIGVGRFDLQTHAFTIVPIAASGQLTGIVTGVDHNVWIGDSQNGNIYKLTP
ncbi:MAG TPA: hypothetical protein VFN49_11800, partial [Candidatus Aquilonibacter sp.]|nr:hypothetical protein [Candidatus Aquilonibacter sp.]